MSEERAAKCPLCGGCIALETISFGSAFGCATCHRSISITKLYEVVVRIVAVVIGFSLAFADSLRDVLLFCLGWMLSPFVVRPVWRVARSVHPPTLTSASSHVVRLNIDSHSNE